MQQITLEYFPTSVHGFHGADHGWFTNDFLKQFEVYQSVTSTSPVTTQTTYWCTDCAHTFSIQAAKRHSKKDCRRIINTDPSNNLPF